MFIVLKRYRIDWTVSLLVFLPRSIFSLKVLPIVLSKFLLCSGLYFFIELSIDFSELLGSGKLMMLCDYRLISRVVSLNLRTFFSLIFSGKIRIKCLTWSLHRILWRFVAMTTKLAKILNAKFVVFSYTLETTSWTFWTISQTSIFRKFSWSFST